MGFHRFKQPAAFLAGFLLYASSAFAGEPGAGLSWKALETRVDSRLGEETIDLVFPFVNESAKPVRITKIDTSCSCTRAAVPSFVTAPGAASEVTVVLNLKGLTGKVRRSLMVHTDASDTPVHLTLEANIFPLVEMGSRLAWWAVGAAPEPRTVELKLSDVPGLAFGGVKSESAQFTVEVKPGADDRTLKLLVAPASTAASAQTRVELTCTLAGVTHRYYLVAVVK